jgi:hypothetical protein
MQLRDHPSLYIWPPKWVSPLDSESLLSEESEELILKKVEIRPPLAAKEGHDRYLWICAAYGGKDYFSTITIFRDPEFFDFLYEKLNNSIGQTMREIGNSEWEEWED